RSGEQSNEWVRDLVRPAPTPCSAASPASGRQAGAAWQACLRHPCCSGRTGRWSWWQRGLDSAGLAANVCRRNESEDSGQRAAPCARRYIVTVPARGYNFVAPVGPAESDDTPESKTNRPRSTALSCRARDQPGASEQRRLESPPRVPLRGLRRESA